MRKIFFYTLALCCAFSVFSCKKTKNSATNSLSGHTSVQVPDFSADSAYFYIAKQVSFGARVPNTAAHSQCAEYLVATLQSFGAEVVTQRVQLQAFDGTALNAANIIASFQPAKVHRILLCAHWDSRPFADQDPDRANFNTPVLGANDGASGVGVLLEVARLLATDTLTAGVDIIFFDAEDYGAPDNVQVANSAQTWCLGSQYWSKNPHKTDYTAQYGILLDMVGAPDAVFFREYYSDYYAPNIVNKVWQKAEELGFSQYFSNQQGGSVLDDHLPVNQNIGIPTINIIHYNPNSLSKGFDKYWHTVKDDMKNIDKKTLKAVGTTLVNIIYNE
ncbi:MAG: M28 family peptidase [Prevotellaceae bacterium]|jgi:Zn-dependent M28 family amino/carboxypeptidase|nr:M28 family peptidase [Prevotellaceae bacterium]